MRIMEKEISGLKREIKRAKLFEIQRLVRRIRQLANKKGTEAQLKKNQRKVERLEKELEFLKDAEVAEIIRRITNKKSDEVRNSVDQELEESHEDIDLEKRALDRVINSTKLQQFLKRVAAKEKDATKADQRKSDADASPKKTQRKNVKNKSKAAKSFASSEPQPKEENVDNTSSDEEEPRQQKATNQKATMDTSLASNSDQDLEDSEDCKPYLSMSDFSESDFGEESDDISSSEFKPKGLESCFVQTMSGLKETSNAKNKRGKEKGKGVNKKGQKNRKGQHARQQMWEKIHGKSAKHLTKKKAELGSKESKNPKKQQNVKMQNSVKRKDDGEMLHPSWEATKRRKLQESMKVEFKGQKIRFDDSE